MEPDDQSLHHLLDTTQPAGPDDLRSIVARAGRHRVRFAALAAGTALLVGGGVAGAIGYASSDHSNHAVQTAGSPEAGNSATAGSTGSSGVASVSPAGIYGALGTTALTHEFTRTANGVDIRAYQVASRALLPEGAARCSIDTTPRLEAEVSTDKAVGTFGSAFDIGTTAGAIRDVNGDVFGVAEGDPIGVVVASTSSSVTSVSVRFAGGATDQMAPSGGWVVLAGAVPANWAKKATAAVPQIGTLTAFNAAGAKVFSRAFSIGGFPSVGSIVPQPAFCACGGPIVRPGRPLPATGALPPATVPPITPNAPRTGASSGTATYACPAIQGNAGAGSGSAKSGTVPSGVPTPVNG